MQIPVQLQPRTLLGVVNKRPVIPGLFKELFFTRRDPLATSSAELHSLVRGKKLVPFVTNYEGGTLEEKTKREVQTVETPRLRPKKAFRAPELIDITEVGQSPVLPLGVSLEAALDRAVVEDVDDLMDRIELTVEFMCSRSLTGTLDVEQENVHVQVDYRMPATNKVVLTGGDLWSAYDTSTPVDDFEAWAAVILEASGLAADTCVMAPDVWTKFRRHPQVKDELDTRRLEGSLLSPKVQSFYKGNINGVDIYSYSGTYEDASGTPRRLIDAGELIFGSRDAECSIVFGVPEDIDAGKRPMQFFAKSFKEDDPSALFLLIESRPLPWPKQIGGFIHSKVL